jgi:hypothetical protein
VRAEGSGPRLRAAAPVLAAAIGVVTVLVVVNQVSRIARSSQTVAPVAAATHSDVAATNSEVPSSAASDGVLGYTPPPVPPAIASLEAASSMPAPTPKASRTPSPSVSAKPKPAPKPSPSPSVSASSTGVVTSIGPAQASVVVVNGNNYAIRIVIDGAGATVPAHASSPPLVVTSSGKDTLQLSSADHPTCGVNQTGDFHLVAPHRYELRITSAPGCMVGGTDVGSPTTAGFTQIG